MTSDSSFTELPDGVSWRGDGETVLVQAWGENSLRFRATRAGAIADTDYALLPQPDQPVDVSIDGESAVVTNGGITAVLTSSTRFNAQVGHVVSSCKVEYRDAEGRPLLRELDTGGSLKLQARNYLPIIGGDHKVIASFAPNPGEKLYGMGQYQQELLDIKGCTFELAHRNSQASVPFVLSSAGYGLLWHNPAIGRATFAANRTEWVAESTLQLDYWITAGSTPARHLRRVRRRDGARADDARARPRVLAVQAPLLEPGAAPRGRPRAPPPRPADGRHRRRLLPLAEDGRLPLRGRVLARPAGDGRRAPRARHRAHGLGLAAGLGGVGELRRAHGAQPARPDRAGTRGPDGVRGTQHVRGRHEPRGTCGPVGAVP